MKTKTQTATAKTAYGKTLETPINYTFSVEEYETHAEVVANKDELTAEETVKVRNVERTNNARQKALTAALDAAGIVKPTIENDEQFRLRKMFDIFKASGHTDESAKAAASAALNIEWLD